MRTLFLPSVLTACMLLTLAAGSSRASAQASAGLEDASPVNIATPGPGLVRAVDEVGAGLDLFVPAGGRRVVIQPGSDALDERGWIAVYDGAGREIAREPEPTGLALHLLAPGTLVRRLDERPDGRVEIRCPSGTARIRLVSQNYDRDSEARQDGRLVAYDGGNRVLADEMGLALDILSP